MVKISIILAGVLLSTITYAQNTKKIDLSCDMLVNECFVAEDVDNFTDMLEKGKVYGRFRTNYFSYDFKHEIAWQTKDHYGLDFLMWRIKAIY